MGGNSKALLAENHELMASSGEGSIETKLRNRRTNSPCLHGVHRLTRRLLVQVDAPEHRKTMSHPQAKQNPVFQS